MEDWIEITTQQRKQAKEALNRAVKQTPTDQYKVGDRVWLEAKNLNLPYQMPKLAPKCHGPFIINKRILPVAYQLQCHGSPSPTMEETRVCVIGEVSRWTRGMR